METKLSELVHRRMALDDRLSRTDIRAPDLRPVNELKVHTVGGVITPAEVLATIVPSEAILKVEVKIAPFRSIKFRWGGRRGCGSRRLTSGRRRN